MTTTCQHTQITNATWKCTKCASEMVARREVQQRQLTGSSPNAPTTLVGFEVHYDCERCAAGETSECGGVHRGEYLDAAGKSRRD